MNHRHTHHQMIAGSENIPNNRELMSYPLDAFQVLFLHDGTSTIAELLMKTQFGNGVVARGLARRRKTDKRDIDLAESLALARMFKAAADHYAGVSRELGVEPFAVPLGRLVAEERKPVEHVQVHAPLAEARAEANGT